MAGLTKKGKTYYALFPMNGKKFSKSLASGDRQIYTNPLTHSPPYVSCFPMSGKYQIIVFGAESMI